MSRRLVFLVFALALAVRVYHLNIPFVERYNSLSRQALSGMVARNFYERGFKLWNPEIDNNGRGPYLYPAEFQFFTTYLMAVGYRLAGGVYEGVARSVSVAYSMFFLWVLYLLLRRTAGEAAALGGLIFAAFSPLSVALSRSIQPEMAMLCFSTAAVYLFYCYQETKKIGFFVGSLFCLMAAILIKVVAVFVLLPLIYLAWRGERREVFRRSRNYFYLFFSLASLSWYRWMFLKEKASVLPYHVYRWMHHEPQDFISLGSVAFIIKILSIHLLTFAGTLLVIRVIGRKRRKTEGLFNAWGLAMVVYFLCFFPYFVKHSYYQLPFIPVLAYFVGMGVDKWMRDETFGRTIKNSLTTLLAIITLANCFYFYGLLYFIPAERQDIVKAGSQVEKLTPKDSLIVAAYGASPIQLYYCRRKGWAFNLLGADEEAKVKRLEELRQAGADYFVTSQRDRLKVLSAFEGHLQARYRIVKQSSGFVIYDLQ